MSRLRDRIKRWKRSGFYHAGLPRAETVSIWIERQRFDVSVINADTCSTIADKLATLLAQHTHADAMDAKIQGITKEQTDGT